MTFIKSTALGVLLAAMLSAAPPASAERLKPGEIIAGIAGIALLAHILDNADDGRRRTVVPQTQRRSLNSSQTRWPLGAYRSCLRRGQANTFFGARCVADVNAQLAANPRAFRNSYTASPPRFVAATYGDCLRQRWTSAGWQTHLGVRCVRRTNAEQRASARGFQQPRFGAIVRNR